VPLLPPGEASEVGAVTQLGGVPVWPVAHCGSTPFPPLSQAVRLHPAPTCLKKPQISADPPGFGEVLVARMGRLDAELPGEPPAQVSVDGPPTTTAMAHGGLLGTQLVVIVNAPGLPAMLHIPDDVVTLAVMAPPLRAAVQKKRHADDCKHRIKRSAQMSHKALQGSLEKPCDKRRSFLAINLRIYVIFWYLYH